MKTYQKILLGLFFAALIILGGIQIYFSYYLDDQIKQTVESRFHSATDNAYYLEIEDLHLKILGRQLSISETTLRKREETGSTNIHAAIDNITFSGIGFLNFLFRQNVTISQIEVMNPRLSVTSPKTIEAKNKKEKWIDISRSLSESILQEVDHISIPNFIIRGLSLDYNREDLPIHSLLSLENSSIRLYNIEIDSSLLKDNRILPTENMEATFRDIDYQTPDELYEISAGQLELSTTNKRMHIDSIQLIPKYERHQFAKKVGHETDRITITLDHINWEGIDSEQLNRGNGLSGQHIALKNADIDIYRDKRLPFPTNTKPPLPQQMIRSIPFPVDIDSIKFLNSNIRYSERTPKSEESGFIDFSDVSATFENVSNDKEEWKEENNPRLRAEAKIMDKARLITDFSFNMADSSYKQFIKGNLQPMDMKPLNKALEPLALIRIEDGKILGMDFDMTLSEQRAEGEVTLRYEKLKISLLNKEGTKEEFKNKISSLIANTFKIKSGNKGDDPRIGKVDFEREEEKSTFNYWWKSLLSGLQSSIGL